MSEEIERIIKECSCIDTFDYVITPQQRDTMRLAEYIKELQQENQQLKLTNQALSGCLKIDKEKIDYYVDRCEQLEKVLDEIREVINQNMSSYSSCIKAFDEIEEILDKAGKQ